MYDRCPVADPFTSGCLIDVLGGLFEPLREVFSPVVEDTHHDHAQLVRRVRVAGKALADCGEHFAIHLKGVRIDPGALKLTLPQYVALAALAERPGITSAELARACLVSPQAMMVVLKAMEEQGLVERTPHPRHQTVLEIHLTRVGGEALSAARKRAEPIEQRITEALSEREINALRALLRRCIEAVEGATQLPAA